MMQQHHHHRAACHTWMILLLLVVRHGGVVKGRKAIGGSGGLMSGNAASRRNPGFFDIVSNTDTATSKLVSIPFGWTIPPLNSDLVIRRLGRENREVARVISDHLSGNRALTVHLKSREVTFRGSRYHRTNCIRGSPTNPFAKKIRAIWTPTNTLTAGKKSMIGGASPEGKTRRSAPSALLTRGYEETLSGLYSDRIEIEVLLPTPASIIKKQKTLDDSNVPSQVISVVYSFPVGGGVMNDNKSRVLKSRGLVKIYPRGRNRKILSSSREFVPADGVDKKDEDDDDDGGIELGWMSAASLAGGPGLVDWTWAKGKKVFWQGRKVGQL